MPQITAIKPQKRKKDRLNVFIDGKFSFGANAQIALKYSLKPGKKLEQKTIDEVYKSEESSTLFEAALNFISYRPRSEKEVEDYLVKKIAQKQDLKYQQAKESDLISQVISKLKKYNYVSDNEFTKWWIDSRNKSRPKGRQALKVELFKKGIDKNIIEEALENLTNQPQLANKALEKKIKSWRNLSEINFKKKAYRHLASRGFDFDTIKEVVANFIKKS